MFADWPLGAGGYATSRRMLRAMSKEGRRERKVVTVVFCDLVGFTARAETLDP